MKNNGKKDSLPALQSLGRALGVSERTVSRLRAAGMPSELDAAKSWYRRRLRTKEDSVERAKVSASLQYRRAKRRLAELELGVQTGNLIPLATLRRELIERELVLKDRLLLIPHTVPPQLVGKGRTECEKILTEAFLWACEPWDELPACLRS